MLITLPTLLAPSLATPLDQEPHVEVQAPPPAESKWAATFSTYLMSPPHADDYLSAILAADKGQLHLEARWAYEDRDTASIFGGWSFPVEGDISGSVTPMLGFAFGDTDGIIPALSLELSWTKLTFTTEAEYLIGTSSESDDFFYSWSELGWAFSDRFTFGLVGQRTNVFDQELSVDRGLFASVGLGQTYVTGYVFNLDQDDPYVMLAFGGHF